MISTLAARLARRKRPQVSWLSQTTHSRPPVLLSTSSSVDLVSACDGWHKKKDNFSPFQAFRCFSWAVIRNNDQPIIIESKEDTIADARKQAKVLADYQINPEGSYTISQFLEAKRILDVFIKNKATDPDSVSSSIDLMMRLAKEMAIAKETDEERPDFFCEPSYYRPLIRNWGEVAKLGQIQTVTLPRDLFLKLETMSRLLPDFQYDAETVGIIVSAAIQQANPKRAPVLAEDLLELIIKEVSRSEMPDMKSYVVVYNKIIQAWADSGVPTAPVNMDTVLKNMRKKGVNPDAETHTIFLNYWGKRSIVHKIEQILEDMKKDGMELSAPILAELVDGYSTSGKTDKANAMLCDLLERKHAGEEEQVKLVGKCALNVFLAHQRTLQSKVAFERKERALKLAEGLYERIKDYPLLSSELRSKCF